MNWEIDTEYFNELTRRAGTTDKIKIPLVYFLYSIILQSSLSPFSHSSS
jgi:hypothetical protein